MSWDVLLLRVPEGTRSVQELDAAWQPPHIGRRLEVLDRLRTAFPTADFTDTSWVVLNGADFSIEFSVGNRDPVDALMLHVRGGPAAFGAVLAAAEAFEAGAIDCSAGDLIDPSSPDATAGFEQWRAYRDRVVAHDT